MLHILVGFHKPEFEEKLISLLKEQGHTVSITEKLTKLQIREHILLHPECRTLILKEKENAMEFSAEDFVSLNDDAAEDFNIICFLKPDRKGTSYMQTLYAGGVRGAVFGNEKGIIHTEEVADLCKRIRTRKETKKYYGIAEIGPELKSVLPETYSVFLNALLHAEDDNDLILRYLTVSSGMTAFQNADFLNRLPVKIKETLGQYREFYEVTDVLKKQGIRVSTKRPKNLKSAEYRTESPVETKEEYDYGSDAFASLVFELTEKETKKEETKTEERKEKPGLKKAKYPVILILIAVLLFITALVFFGVKKRNPTPETVSEESEIIKPLKEPDVIRIVEPLVPAEEYLAGYINTEEEIGGAEVVKIINSYPNEQFRVLFVRDNKQIIYTGGGANPIDIPIKDFFTVTNEDKEYVFTKKEETEE